jgi:SAM-dependent methyltransferase
MANGLNIIGAGQERPSLGAKTILDACCGSRMFWFDKSDPLVVFLDNRRERHELPDVSSSGGRRTLDIAPDVRADFSAMPFADCTFQMVVFDPPHFKRNGAKSWVGLKYGTLRDGWRDMLRDGFSECFRVLLLGGTLIFKWCDVDIRVSEILALTPHRPLFGHKSGKNSNTHWICFMKGEESPVLGEESPAQDTKEICHTAPNRRNTQNAQVSMDL